MKINSIGSSKLKERNVVDVELADVTILYGPNGSGKTTHLDIIKLLSDAALQSTERTRNDEMTNLIRRGHREMEVRGSFDNDFAICREWNMGETKRGKTAVK